MTERTGRGLAFVVVAVLTAGRTVIDVDGELDTRRLVLARVVEVAALIGAKTLPPVVLVTTPTTVVLVVVGRVTAGERVVLVVLVVVVVLVEVVGATVVLVVVVLVELVVVVAHEAAKPRLPRRTAGPCPDS